MYTRPMIYKSLVRPRQGRWYKNENALYAYICVRLLLSQWNRQRGCLCTTEVQISWYVCSDVELYLGLARCKQTATHLAIEIYDELCGVD
jgi:hypothetical protein